MSISGSRIRISRQRSEYPYHLQRSELPPGYRIMPLPGLVSPIEALRWTSKVCGS